MSVLNGATNTTINGGVFSAVSNTVVNGVDPRNDVVSELLVHSAAAGLLDAAERFDAPKCDEGTRTSMLQGMKAFVQQSGGPALYWLHGPAGVGKSALCQSLALALKEEGDHAASFFFSRTAPGRNDGGQLIVTLACQLALNVPLLKPILAKTVKNNPFVLKATNAVKMQTLIVDPLNQLHKSLQWSPRSWAQRLAKRQSYPRLILVDGLDECDDPLVQRDLILCVGQAVSHLALPFRFVIASRPEYHILATFQLEPIFHGRTGVDLTVTDLGDDEDADTQITTFLVQQFEEIRRTHPIREFLPQEWPLPDQVAQLVSKSSYGFIYPATVMRYIKMPKNRPDECLERILGLSEVPVNDKPYEPVDVLYRHIFESVPDDHKVAVHDIFHFLVVPHALEDVITPRLIEQYFEYKPGHVQHVLRDLLCIIALPGIDQTIKVLHASLPDFLLDSSRSRTMCIRSGDAHAMIIAALYKVRGVMFCTNTSTFTHIIDHLMNSNMTGELVDILHNLNPLCAYKQICDAMQPESGWHLFADIQAAWDDFLEVITSIVAYLLILDKKWVSETCIHSHIKGIEAHILRTYPLCPALRLVRDPSLSAVFPSLQKCIDTGGYAHIRTIYKSQPGYGMQYTSSLVERIAKLHVLMMAPFSPGA